MAALKWERCSGAASPGAAQMLLSSPACGEPNVHCTLITKLFQRGFSPSPPALYFNFLPKSLGKDVKECGSLCATIYIQSQPTQRLPGI